MKQNRLIGEIMIEMGLASRELVVDCLHVQSEIYSKGLDPIPIGKLLVKTGYVSLEQLEKALQRQRRCRMAN